MKPEVLLVGEPLGLFMAHEEGSLDNVDNYSLAVAGAEINVAIGLSRLGHRASYLTKLGEDPIGKRVMRLLKQHKIKTSSILTTKEYTTGFMMKGLATEGDPNIAYYRKGTAASKFSAEDSARVDIDGFTHLHLTGIFPALSGDTFGATLALILRAKRRGMTISFDPNLRPQLWKNKNQMVTVVNAIAKAADIILPGQSEGELLMGSAVPEDIAAFYLKMGAKTVVVKTGSKGAFLATKDMQEYIAGFKVDKVIDTVGAGDGFAVGLIAALQEGKDVKEAVKWANAIGAIQVTFRGDNEGLPTRDLLAKFIGVDKL